MPDAAPPRASLDTLERHLERKKTPESRGAGDVAGVVAAVALAGKHVAHEVRRARIDDVLGDAGERNLHGERQQKLDVLADELLLAALRDRPDVALYASEERDEPVVLRSGSQGGSLCVTVDPLDGSSNVDVAVSVGTVFSVLRNDRSDEETARAPLQPGARQIAAGYLLYGSSVALVLTRGEGVDLYVLDPVLGDFLLVEEGLRIPERKRLYSVNEAYVEGFSEGLRAYLAEAHAEGYASRYIGSMVADVHRTLLKGGVFLYPATTKDPKGKLRLLYEASPMALIVEQAGGLAADGAERILDVTPTELHQRTPVVLGSPAEVEKVMRHLA